jgi:uncharacterized membrane protein YcaP (DUF421 family)
VDPLRLAVRVLFAYVLLLLFVRLTGHRTVKHGSPFDFTVALILGDMIDDAIWAEVSAAQFVVACGVLFTVHTMFDVLRFRAGAAR